MSKHAVIKHFDFEGNLVSVTIQDPNFEDVAIYEGADALDKALEHCNDEGFEVEVIDDEL